MKTSLLRICLRNSGIMVILLLTVLSCKKLPEPDFSYTPRDNPEAGDTIRFTNESSEANTYDWEFGDGGTSNQENPVYIYEEAGIFDVKLTAFNEAGEEAKTEALTINEPTILGFFITDSTGEIALSGAEALVYDNESDRDNMAEPQFSDIADNDGIVIFNNMEAINYHILIVKLEEDGFWGVLGSTGVLNQNEFNGFEAYCDWYDYTQKKTTSSIREILNGILNFPPGEFPVLQQR